jgi:hypothetical protein
MPYSRRIFAIAVSKSFCSSTSSTEPRRNEKAKACISGTTSFIDQSNRSRKRTYCATDPDTSQITTIFGLSLRLLAPDDVEWHAIEACIGAHRSAHVQLAAVAAAFAAGVFDGEAFGDLGDQPLHALHVAAVNR